MSRKETSGATQTTDWEETAHRLRRTLEYVQRDRTRACEALQRARELLRGLVEAEDRPCAFDRHGHCQEHGWFGEPGECYTAMARKAVGLQ